VGHFSTEGVRFGEEKTLPLVNHTFGESGKGPSRGFSKPPRVKLSVRPLIIRGGPSVKNTQHSFDPKLLGEECGYHATEKNRFVRKKIAAPKENILAHRTEGLSNEGGW